MNPKLAPCKGCQERHPGCQTDACPRWKEWHERQQARKKAIFKKRWLDTALRKVGSSKGKEKRPARLLQNKSHKREGNRERMETRMDESDRIREEVREREVRD